MFVRDGKEDSPTRPNTDATGPNCRSPRASFRSYHFLPLVTQQPLPPSLPVDIYQWLIRPSEALYVDELEDLLDDFMLSLNTEIDDGSIEEIADSLMIMHEACLHGNFALIGRLSQPVPTTNQHIQVVNGGEDDLDSTSSSGDESMVLEEKLYM